MLPFPNDPLEGAVARTTPIGGAIEVEKVVEEEEKSGFILQRKRRFQREMEDGRQEPVSVKIQISDVKVIFPQVTQRTQRQQEQEILLAVNYTQYANCTLYTVLYTLYTVHCKM